jgi:diguanylate cyclase (GGDEF)-like protein
MAELTSTKRALLSLSHAMENTILDGLACQDGSGLIVGLFQRRAYFDIEAARYAELAARGVTCIVGFVGDTDRLPPGVHAVSLEVADPLANEWTLVFLDESMGSALVATDLGQLAQGEDSLEAARLFRGCWTFQQQQAAGVAARLMNGLGAGLAPDVELLARDLVERFSRHAPDPDRDRLDRITEHLVAQIDQGHQRSFRLKAALRSTRDLAEVDQLTGLRNRHYLERFLGSSIDGSPMSLAALLIDLDGLKSINDTHGHGAGDVALQTAAACILENTRNADVACRLGGDEFLVLLPGMDAEQGLLAGQRIADAIATAVAPQPWAGLTLRASVGVAMADPRQLPLELLDAALYAVKREGKGGARLAA